MDAIPLPPQPNLEEYQAIAEEFQRACRMDEAGAVRDFAARFGLEAQRTGQHWRKANDAQAFVALEHAFASWPEFARHVEALASHDSPVSQFEAAADAIITGDVDALGKLLAENPELIRQRSTRAHRSTLLHYVSANGIEDFRQKTPPNIIEITRLLLDAGADVNAESDAYGGGSTALVLVATSVHPERAGVQIELMQALLGRGARIHPGSIRSCMANGQPKAAEFLAAHGAPIDMEEAAGLGRLELVKAYLNGPASVSQEQMGASLRWAVYRVNVELVNLLVQHGAPVEGAMDVAQYVLGKSQDDLERERCREVIRSLNGGRPR